MSRKAVANKQGRFLRNRWPGGWTAQEVALLGTDDDEAVAERLGRSRSAVRSKRYQHRMTLVGESVGAADGVVSAEALDRFRGVAHQVDRTAVATEAADQNDRPSGFVARTRHVQRRGLPRFNVPAREGALLARGEVMRSGHQRSPVRREPQQPAASCWKVAPLFKRCDVPHPDRVWQ